MKFFVHFLDRQKKLHNIYLTSIFFFCWKIPTFDFPIDTQLRISKYIFYICNYIILYSVYIRHFYIGNVIYLAQIEVEYVCILFVILHASMLLVCLTVVAVAKKFIDLTMIEFIALFIHINRFVLSIQCTHIILYRQCIVSIDSYCLIYVYTKYPYKQ